MDIFVFIIGLIIFDENSCAFFVPAVIDEVIAVNVLDIFNNKVIVATFLFLFLLFLILLRIISRLPAVGMIDYFTRFRIYAFVLFDFFIVITRPWHIVLGIIILVQ